MKTERLRLIPPNHEKKFDRGSVITFKVAIPIKLDEIENVNVYSDGTGNIPL